MTDSASPAATATLTFALTVNAAAVRGQPTLAWNWGFTSGSTIWRGVLASYTAPDGYSVAAGQAYRFRYRSGGGSWTTVRSSATSLSIRFSTADTAPLEAEVSVLVNNDSDALDSDWTEWSDTLDITNAPGSSSEDSPIPVYITLDGAPVMADDKPLRTIEPQQQEEETE